MYCYFRNIVDFYNKVSQILDTQSKKTLWKFILLKLTPPHQEYCLNKINLSEEVLLGNHLMSSTLTIFWHSLVIISATLSIGLEYHLPCSVKSRKNWYSLMPKTWSKRQSIVFIVTLYCFGYSIVFSLIYFLIVWD